VAGGDGSGLPRTSPAAEHFDEASIEAVRSLARRAGLGALLVTRNNHLVLEYYGAGWAASDEPDAGALVQVLAAMAAGVATSRGLIGPPDLRPFDAGALASAIAQAAKLPYEQYLSQRIWQPLRASPAHFLLAHTGEAPRPDCCFAARLSDWMRVGGALDDDGRYEGTQVLPAGWVARMRLPRIGEQERGFGVLLANAATGKEPLAARDAFFVRGEGAWRLWIVPSLQLVILSAGEDSAAGQSDETALPNQIMRAINGPGTSLHGPAQLKDLVPGH
jgi:CubicO group peptidase (beta-lactamase class C family)